VRSFGLSRHTRCLLSNKSTHPQTCARSAQCAVRLGSAQTSPQIGSRVSGAKSRGNRRVGKHLTSAFQNSKHQVLERSERSAILRQSPGSAKANLRKVQFAQRPSARVFYCAQKCQLHQIEPSKVRWNGLEECVLNMQTQGLGSRWAIRYTGKHVRVDLGSASLFSNTSEGGG